MVPIGTAPAPYTPNALPTTHSGEIHPLAALPANDNGQFASSWVGSLDPDRRASFDQLAKTTNMPHADLARALAAHGAMEARFPGSTAGTEMPNYADVHGFYGQLPPEYQNALRDFQGWHMQALGEGGAAGTRRPDAMRPGQVSGQLVRGVDQRPQNWILQPDADVGDPNQLHNPDRYENMRAFADLHGVDVTSPSFQRFWQQQQQRWADPAQRPAGGVPQLIEMYRGQNAQQQDRQQATADTAQPHVDAQRFLGMRRTDPATQQEYTVANPKGRARMGVMDHLSGIGRTVGSGFAALPAIGADVGSSLETGVPETSTSRMAGRSLLDYPNRLLGTDIGHDVESRPLRFRPGQTFGNVDIGPDAGRGLFGSSLTNTPSNRRPGNGPIAQHGAMPAYEEAFRQQRLDPATGGAGRLGYGILEHLAGNAETYAGLAGGTGLFSNAARSFGAMGAGARGAATAAGPTRLFSGASGNLADLAAGASRAGAGTTGAFQRFHNPVIDTAGQLIRTIPTGQDSNVGNWLDDISMQAALDDARPNTTLPQRLWSSARRNFAGLVPGAPTFATDLRQSRGAPAAQRALGVGRSGLTGMGLGIGADMAFQQLHPRPAPSLADQAAMRGTIGTSESERLRREREMR